MARPRGRGVSEESLGRGSMRTPARAQGADGRAIVRARACDGRGRSPRFVTSKSRGCARRLGSFAASEAGNQGFEEEGRFDANVHTERQKKAHCGGMNE